MKNVVAAPTAGYSGTPLAKKLGIKEGFLMLCINAPDNFEQLLAPLPHDVEILKTPRVDVDLIHLFTNSRDELFSKLAECVKLIKQNGTIWVSWYKRAAKLPTEITEDTIREAAFPLGLVDVKVCAVDEKWSGLKLVIRKENRIQYSHTLFSKEFYMPTTDPFVDAYIEKSKDFAKPILNHIRALVHETCPDVIEKKKWSFPHFDYKGIMCSMASFKEHCAFGFWKQSLMEDKTFPAEKTAMGSFGRITSIRDLPDDKTFKKLIVDAMKLNDNGVKLTKAKPTVERKELVVPEILTAELDTNELAAETFNNFPYSCKKEYIEWITEAKTDATRDKRLATTIEWLSEGKQRNWKYEKC